MAEGVISGNRKNRRTESYLTVKQLKERFLYGVIIKDNDGNIMPDRILQDYIDSAASVIEQYLDINITPVTYEGNPVDGGSAEQQNHIPPNYDNWGYMQLNNTPVIDIKSIKAVFPIQGVLEIPKSWFKLQKRSGQLNLIAVAGSFSAFGISGSGGAGSGVLLPQLLNTRTNVPLLWQIEYTAGFRDGEIPKSINRAIGLIAATSALAIAGDLVIGAGIAGTAISIDGLAESIQTTSSAENHAYSAKVNQYLQELWGSSKDGANKGVLRILKDYFQGAPFQVL